MKKKIVFAIAIALFAIILFCGFILGWWSGGGKPDATAANMHTAETIKTYISERASLECWNILYAEDTDAKGDGTQFTVLVSDGKANITVRLRADFCIPAAAEELLPIISEALEETETDLGRISFSYYRKNSGGIVDGSMVDWTTQDGEKGTFVSDPDDVVHTNYTLDDLQEYYAGYSEIVEKLRKGEDLQDDTRESSSVEAGTDFGDMLDAYQGEWKRADTEDDVWRLFIVGSQISSVCYDDGEVVEIIEHEFDLDENGNLTVTRNGKPEYTYCINEAGQLSSQKNGTMLTALYDKVSETATVPEAPTEKQEPFVGMSESEVYSSTWGTPKKINTTTTENGEREQWVYEQGYIYLENGTVTAIEN